MPVYYTKKDIGRIKQLVKEKDVPFVFVPSSKLSETIAKNESPLIKKLPKPYKDMFLKGAACFIDGKMVIDYLEGTATQENDFILSNGEIRIVDNNFKIDGGKK